MYNYSGCSTTEIFTSVTNIYKWINILPLILLVHRLSLIIIMKLKAEDFIYTIIKRQNFNRIQSYFLLSVESRGSPKQLLWEAVNSLLIQVHVHSVYKLPILNTDQQLNWKLVIKFRETNLRDRITELLRVNISFYSKEFPLLHFYFTSDNLVDRSYLAVFTSSNWTEQIILCTYIQGDGALRV